MKTICSYCRSDMGETEPLEDQRVSHGLCPECAARYQRKCHSQTFGEYLDNFDFPILIVDGNVRINAANYLMARMLGKSERELFGLLGGEALECRHARLEGGCGNTVHCRTCTVRNLVEQTYQTGESSFQVPAFVDREEGRLGFLISSVKLERSVQVVVESLPEPEAEPGDEDPDSDTPVVRTGS